MDLRTPIFKLSDKDIFTLDDCTLGTLIFGAIGSGKTSGPGELIARAFLRHGFGGLVLTGKVNETKRWIEYAKKEKRLKDLVIFSPTKENYLQFNPLLYELRSKTGGREVDNLAGLFTTTMQMSGRATMQSGGGSQDPFWVWAMERLLKSAMHLLILSGKDLTMTNIIKVIRDIPIESETDGRTASMLEVYEHWTGCEDYEARTELEEWGKKSFTIHCLMWALHNAVAKSELRTYDVIKTYFLSEFPRLGSKTRSGITEQLYAFIDPFRTGILAECFTEGLSEELLPEKTYTENKIVVLDFSVKEWLNVGIISQGLYKYMWQKCIERRDTTRFPNPVFLFQDEYQLFSNRYDNLFQSTSRESKACNVVITQNLPNLYATTGGHNPKDYVHSLLGNLGTKIYCANDEEQTNLFAAKSIGQSFKTKNQFNFGGDTERSGGSFSDQRNFQVEPVEFTTFRRGGPQNNFKVDAIVTSTGKKFSNQKNHLRTVFKQNQNN